MLALYTSLFSVSDSPAFFFSWITRCCSVAFFDLSAKRKPSDGLLLPGWKDSMII